MPGDWFAEAPEIGLDREEITVIGRRLRRPTT
jgi:hypothetical protein